MLAPDLRTLCQKNVLAMRGPFMMDLRGVDNHSHARLAVSDLRAVEPDWSRVVDCDGKHLRLHEKKNVRIAP